MKTIISTLISLLVLGNTLSSQIKYEKRIEFELGEGYEYSNIIPQKEDGLLMVYRDENSSGREVEWVYDFYNTNLEIDESKKVSIDKKMSIVSTFPTDKATHTLYRQKSDFIIVTATKSGNELKTIQGEMYKKFSARNMQVLNDYVYVMGSIKKSPAVMTINWKTGQTNILPIAIGDYKTKNTSINNLQVKSKANEVFIFVKGVDSKKESEMFMIKCVDGKIKERASKIGQTGDKNIISISASKIDDNEYLISGTYGVNSTFTSSGLFFGKLNGAEVSFLKFYNFLDLKDFLSYLPEKKQERLEKKKRKKKKKGKEFNASYNIADHDIIKTPENEYIFLGEAYYPTYTTRSRTTYVNGQAVTTTETVFDGYRYTHAVITKFNSKGELIWDNSFEMNPDFKPFYIKRFISLFGDTDKSLNMVFVDRKKIHSKSLDYISGDIIKNESSEELNTGLEGDKTKRSLLNIDYWYDNNYLIHGSQVIKNKGDIKRNRGKRKVFFMSKVSYIN